jgi:isoleucyl-tRNA synthetase
MPRKAAPHKKTTQASRSFFDAQFSLPQTEERVLEFWKEEDVFGQSLKLREGGKQFTFYEGPPGANGRPGIHHVLSRVFKDVVLRYRTMRGYHVPRKSGWDTHGLPVELAAEKALGMKSKKDIERYGVAAFNKKCQELVWEHEEEWKRLTERIGFWLDLENPYVTYSPQYIETLWWIVQQIDQRGHLYRGHKVIPWCTRCGTG